MEYKPVQKKNSSWTPTTVQKKGKSPGKLGHFSIQPKSNPSSAPSQEIGGYSRASADRLTANVMRGIQAKEQEQAEGLTVQRKSESPWAPGFDAAPPITQSPASQLSRDRPCSVSTFAPVSENSIQRQCADCAKQEKEQATEAGKDLEEIGIQTKLTVGAPGDAYEQEADLVETLHATSLQVISMSAPPDSSASVQRQLDTNHPHHPHQIWQRAQSITPVVQKQIDPRVQMAEMIQRAAQIDGNQASFDLESRLNASKGGGSPLSEGVRGFMEPRFGADFSGVRVHTGGEAVFFERQVPPEYLDTQTQTEVQSDINSLKQGGNQQQVKWGETLYAQTGRLPSENNEQYCFDLLQQIISLYEEVKFRYEDLLRDNHKLYRNHRRLDQRHRDYGSWEGHQQKYEKERAKLKRLLDHWDDLCKGDPDLVEYARPDIEDAENYASIPAPQTPLQIKQGFRLPDWAITLGVVVVGGAIIIGATLTLPGWATAALASIAAVAGLRLIDERI
jgi:hypothetical protein